MSKKILLALVVFLITPKLTADSWDDAFKGIKATSQVMSLFAQFNRLRSDYATTSMEIQAMQDQSYYSQRQEEWNRWNGLVSLLSQEQKQMVLKFNTMPDQDLEKLWLIAKTSTQTFPSEWLMPTKLDKVSNFIFDYYTREASVGDYISYLTSISEKNRFVFLENTSDDRKNEIKTILVQKRDDFLIDSKSEFELCENISQNITHGGKECTNWSSYSSERLKEPSQRKNIKYKANEDDGSWYQPIIKN